MFRYIRIFRCFYFKYLYEAILAVTFLSLEPSTRALDFKSKDHCDGSPTPETGCKYFKVCAFMVFFRSSKGSMPSKRLKTNTLVFTSCLLKYVKFPNLSFGARGRGAAVQQRISSLTYRVSPPCLCVHSNLLPILREQWLCLALELPVPTAAPNVYITVQLLPFQANDTRIRV